MSDLSIKAIKGVIWSLAENLGLQFIQLLVSVFLARLLLPEQFGLIGILTLFIGLGHALMDSGFGSALIQKNDSSLLDFCSVFYFNLLIGITLTSLLCLAAPLIAQFYGEPLLTPLTRFLSLNILLNAVGFVPLVQLTKRMDFKALVKVGLISTVISGGVSVSLAMKGMAVWSLAVQSVLFMLLRAMLLWLASRWRPAWLFSTASLAAMFPFGSRMFLSGLLDAFFQNIYQPLIGKLYSAADVGYYVRAQGLQTAATQPAGSALRRVLFPALSSIQDDQARMGRAVRKILTTTVFFHFPLMIGLMAVAEPLVVVLMTERWTPSIPYIRLFCVVGLFIPLQVVTTTVLPATGNSNILFKLEIINKLMILLAIAITFRWGITALLYGQIVTSAAAYCLNSHYSRRFTGYSTVEQVCDVCPYLLMSLLMGAAMHLSGMLIGPALPRLMFQLLVGVSVYLALNYVLSRSMLISIVHLARQVIQLPAAS